MLKAKIGQKLGLEPVSQAVNMKEKLLKKLRSAILVNIWMIRKQSRLIADMGKILRVEIGD